MARRQVLVQLDEELVEQLDEIAAERHVSRSQLLREGGWAVIRARSIAEADRQLQEAYRRHPQDPDLVKALHEIAARNMPEW